QCLRHVPKALMDASSRFAAQCGDDVVSFLVPQAVFKYFYSGAQGSWQTLLDLRAETPHANVTFAQRIFTGAGNNKGWILSSDDPHPNLPSDTFANSYPNTALPDVPTGWDFCNGVDYNTPDGAASTLPVVRLFYR